MLKMRRLRRKGLFPKTHHHGAHSGITGRLESTCILSKDWDDCRKPEREQKHREGGEKSSQEKFGKGAIRGDR